MAEEQHVQLDNSLLSEEDRSLDISDGVAVNLIRTPHRVDFSCRAWIVCCSSAVCVALATGVTFSYGVLLPVFMDYFKENSEKTAWVGSLAICSTFLFGSVAGMIVQKFGCRLTCVIGGLSCAIGLGVSSLVDKMDYLFGSYSLLFGFGCSCLFNSSFVVVTRYFDRYLSLATGLVTAGQSAGIFMFGPALQALIDAYGWRVTLRVIAGIMSLTCILALSYSDNQSASPREDSNTSHYIPSLDVPLHKNVVFVWITAGSAVCMFGEYIPQIHIISYCLSLNIPANTASKVYLLFGLGSSLSRVGTGLICSIKQVNPRWLFQATEYLLGVSVILSSLAEKFPHIAAFFFFYGFFEGIYITTLNIHLLNCTVSKQKPLAFGVSITINALFTASGPPIAGLIIDKLGSFAPAFYMSGAAIILGATIPFMIPLLQKRRPHPAVTLNARTADKDSTVDTHL